jgi:hypothetical protein
MFADLPRGEAVVVGTEVDIGIEAESSQRDDNAVLIMTIVTIIVQGIMVSTTIVTEGRSVSAANAPHMTLVLGGPLLGVRTHQHVLSSKWRRSSQDVSNRQRTCHVAVVSADTM